MITSVKVSDVSQIFHLYKENSLDSTKLDDFVYQEEIQRRGFVLGTETEEDFTKLIQERKYFFAYKEKNRVIGFIYGTGEKDFLDDEHKTWLDIQAKDKYFKDNHSYSIDMIVVARKHQGKGIASMLIKHFEDTLRKDGYHYLFSIVRFLPLTNCASILFHAKNKYIRIATAKPREIYGTKNAASFLFFKELD